MPKHHIGNYAPPEAVRYTLYTFAALLTVILAVTFNFFIAKQENELKEKQLQKQIEEAKAFLDKQ